MLAQAIQFIIESEKLKSVERQTSPLGLSRRENSAKHSWPLTLAATVLIPAVAPDLDQLRILQMLIIHDIVEVDSGDTFCYGFLFAETACPSVTKTSGFANSGRYFSIGSSRLNFPSSQSINATAEVSALVIE